MFSAISAMARYYASKTRLQPREWFRDTQNTLRTMGGPVVTRRDSKGHGSCWKVQLNHTTTTGSGV